MVAMRVVLEAQLHQLIGCNSIIWDACVPLGGDTPGG